MHIYTIAAIIFLSCTSGTLEYSREREFHLLQLYRKISSNETLKAIAEKDAKSLNMNSQPMWVEFTCDIEKSPQVPTSVHKLRPSDINVVSAMGDSVTAGHGVLAKNLVEVLLQDRGDSWSIGGRKPLERIITMPNIIRKFNPKLTGFSTATAYRFMWEARMNVAEAGHMASELPDQADLLIQSLKDDSEIKFKTDWKIMTLFIGGNDLCKYCLDRERRSPKNYIKYIRTALDKLHAAVPRMFVNVVPIFDVTPLIKMSRSIICDLLQENMCSCATDPELAKELPIIQRKYYEGLEALISSGRYDTKEDFTVVLQPFTRDQKPPKKPGTDDYDDSFLSHDCFHPNAKTHAALAVGLWDTMLTPVGKKAFTGDEIVKPKLRCPTKEHPYFFTRKNSGLNIQDKPIGLLQDDAHGNGDLPGCVNCGGQELDSTVALGMIILGTALIILIAGVVLGVVIPRYRKRKAAARDAVTKDGNTVYDNKTFSEHI